MSKKRNSHIHQIGEGKPAPLNGVRSFWVWSECFKDPTGVIRFCNTPTFPWASSPPDGPASSFGKLPHAKPSREELTGHKCLRENLGVAGAIVCDSGGNTHDI